jgi:hypothetical protein
MMEIDEILGRIQGPVFRGKRSPFAASMSMTYVLLVDSVYLFWFGSRAIETCYPIFMVALAYSQGPGSNMAFPHCKHSLVKIHVL